MTSLLRANQCALLNHQKQRQVGRRRRHQSQKHRPLHFPTSLLHHHLLQNLQECLLLLPLLCRRHHHHNPKSKLHHRLPLPKRCLHQRRLPEVLEHQLLLPHHLHRLHQSRKHPRLQAVLELLWTPFLRVVITKCEVGIRGTCIRPRVRGGKTRRANFTPACHLRVLSRACAKRAKRTDK